MNILDKIDCKVEKGDVFTLVSGLGTGKSTILCILAYELVMQGKNVIFISDEVNNNTIATKFKNIVPAETELKGYLVIKTNVRNAVDYLKGDLPKDTDIVILDGYFGNKENLKEIAIQKQIGIMETKQVSRDVISSEIPIGFSNQFMQRSDAVLNVKRTRMVNKLSFLDKLRNALCFWLPKIEESENLTLQVLKNRRGKQGTCLYPINFQEINKK
jgi:energy-coupling factor transporter ATP-binding protein EcfA2